MAHQHIKGYSEWCERRDRREKI